VPENIQADLKRRFGPAFLGVQEVAQPRFMSAYSDARQVSVVFESGRVLPLALVRGIHVKTDLVEGGED
jgi:hypothetical protein